MDKRQDNTDAAPASPTDGATIVPLPAAPGVGGGAGDADGAPSASTHFMFKNKVFDVPGAYFSLAKDNNEPTLNVQLGDIWGKIGFRAVKEAFGIADDSSDAALLGVVERGLKFVKTIRPGDSIPRELLDGTASWRVDDRHLMIARGRLTMQLVSWITGNEMLITDRTQLEQMAEDPTTKQRVQQAFAELARRFGLPEERRQEVVDRVEQLARELSYIEALRDRFNCAQRIISNCTTAARLYKTDRQIQADVSRMMALIKQPLAEFENLFLQTDAQTAEIMSVLKSMDSQVAFIRSMRDEAHTRLMLWDEIIDLWGDEPLERGPELEAKLKKTYQFLAQNFLVSKVWQRSG